jgi:hypothetical protein
VNAPFDPKLIDEAKARRQGKAPAFEHHSAFDWGVMVYGGDNPRTGFPQEPLEFAFFAGHYSRSEIEARAADLAEKHHRTHWAIQAPVNADMRGLCRGLA